MTYLKIDAQWQFLLAFQDFWVSDPASRILSALRESPCPYCSCVRSWTKGGCLVGAEAMRRWMENSLDTLPCGARVSLAAVATDETDAAHVLVALRIAGKSGSWMQSACGRGMRLSAGWRVNTSTMRTPWFPGKRWWLSA